MKKLMIAAAAAAMVGGAYASDCLPDCPIVKDVARVYQVQMNVYTTKGVMQTVEGFGASTCTPGENACLVMRGKDKTVLRGYVYICGNPCEFLDYQEAFVDARRGAFFGTFDDDGEFTSAADFSWEFCNIIGARSTDAECVWDFTGTVTYDEMRAQDYTLKGAGYGKFVHSTEGYFDNLSGYFAGTATASYDLKSKYFNVAKEGEDPDPCNCKPSQVLKCDDIFAFTEGVDTVAFGAWKMKFNANVSKALAEGKWNPIAAIKKLFK